MDYEVSILQFAQTFGLANLTRNIDITNRKLKYAKVNRPGLQLAGFFDYFDAQRLQIIGMVEYTYLEGMSAERRETVFKRLFDNNIPCLVICRNLMPFPEMLAAAIASNTPVLTTPNITTDFIGEVIRWLKVELAPRLTMHGVLVDVHGEGLLITGESGIGKSEMALELIKRGHKLVADDAVEIKKVSNQTLIGSCPEIIRFFIELRGIGIIDVSKMFGIQAIKETQTIDLVIKLEMWDNNKEYDRLGLENEYIEILGNNVVCQTIPIRPGRNLAMIGESAAVNHRQKKMGYSAAKALSDKLAQRNSAEG
ncbi:MAG: HPr(Ser) kinase/phosphatase [Defluviitaleaceae bacterium]|nr:HPr(Ser) kinase/phosphatase [Defluviitaleaceae bacterium]